MARAPAPPLSPRALDRGEAPPPRRPGPAARPALRRHGADAGPLRAPPTYLPRRCPSCLGGAVVTQPRGSRGRDQSLPAGAEREGQEGGGSGAGPGRCASSGAREEGERGEGEADGARAGEGRRRGAGAWAGVGAEGAGAPGAVTSAGGCRVPGPACGVSAAGCLPPEQVPSVVQLGAG